MRWIIVAVLAAIGATLFVLPHHLGEILEGNSLAQNLKEMLTGEVVERPRALFVQGLMAIGCVSVLLPGLLASLTALAPANAMRALMIAGGLAMIAAGFLAFVVVVVSNMTFGFGGGGARFPATTVAALAPLFPIVCGTAAVVMGVARIRLP